MDGSDRMVSYLASYAEVSHIDGWMDGLLPRHDYLDYLSTLTTFSYISPYRWGICTSYEYMGDGEIFFLFPFL